MAKLVGVAVAALLLFAWPDPGAAQEKGTASVRLAMARAMCTTGPCAPAYNFRTGFVQFKKQKQPRPLTRREVGVLRLDGVSSTGPPLPTVLDGVVSARVNFATTDPDADCADTGADLTQVVATSTMNCRTKGPTSSSCRGKLVLSPGVFSDPNCTDVQVFLSDIVVEIFENGGVGDDTKKIARNGALVIGKTPDCNSGGSGCP